MEQVRRQEQDSEASSSIANGTMQGSSYEQSLDGEDNTLVKTEPNSAMGDAAIEGIKIKEEFIPEEQEAEESPSFILPIGADHIKQEAEDIETPSIEVTSVTSPANLDAFKSNLQHAGIIKEEGMNIKTGNFEAKHVNDSSGTFKNECSAQLVDVHENSGSYIKSTQNIVSEKSSVEECFATKQKAIFSSVRDTVNTTCNQNYFPIEKKEFKIETETFLDDETNFSSQTGGPKDLSSCTSENTGYSFASGKPLMQSESDFFEINRSTFCPKSGNIHEYGCKQYLNSGIHQDSSHQESSQRNPCCKSLVAKKKSNKINFTGISSIKTMTTAKLKKNWANKTNPHRKATKPIALLKKWVSPDCRTCRRCDTSFESAEACLQHVEKHKMDKFFCKVCPLSFLEEDPYKKHLKTHACTQFTCQQCHAMFWSRRGLTAHSSKNCASFKCSLCQSHFILRNSFEAHLIDAHFGKPIENELPCPRCNRCFIDPVLLHDHLIGQHCVIHRCHLCPSEFVDIILIWHHRDVMHRGSKVFHCPYCFDVFYEKELWMAHVPLHNDMYVCTECSANFDTEKKLTQHKREECLFRLRLCLYCDAKFKTETELLDHISQLHNTISDRNGDFFRRLHFRDNYPVHGKTNALLDVEQCVLKDKNTDNHEQNLKPSSNNEPTPLIQWAMHERQVRLKKNKRKNEQKLMQMVESLILGNPVRVLTEDREATSKKRPRKLPSTWELKCFKQFSPKRRDKMKLKKKAQKIVATMVSNNADRRQAVTFVNVEGNSVSSCVQETGASDPSKLIKQEENEPDKGFECEQFGNHFIFGNMDAYDPIAQKEYESSRNFQHDQYGKMTPNCTENSPSAATKPMNIEPFDGFHHEQ
ncbi:uncharacterized protein [Bemisia tabaci]|uniref:uncharacterized protein isoform X1 n=1 Tax=Bemisia tabaci TaxID=7038 RepID=UPI003B286BBB